MAAVYVDRGLEPALAEKVADQPARPGSAEAFVSRHGLGLRDLTNYVAHPTGSLRMLRPRRYRSNPNTRYRAAREALPERDLPPQHRAEFAPARWLRRNPRSRPRAIQKERWRGDLSVPSSSI